MQATTELFRQNAYQTECPAQVLRLERNADGLPVGMVLDQTVFYPLSGGQAGDTGSIRLQTKDGELLLPISDTRKAKNADGTPSGEILHVFGAEIGTLSNIHGTLLLSLLNSLFPQEPDAAPAALAPIQAMACIDWARRHRLMRFHTTTHLLCHLVPALVNGCSISPDSARMDFSMTDALDKDELTASLAKLVAARLPVVVGSITDEQLDANPALVKSMSVSPPRGLGFVRTIRIGTTDLQVDLVDLQPCGGTHVANTGEIGHVIVTKIEKKSATTRRVVLAFA